MTTDDMDRTTYGHDFEALPWHDAELREVLIDRRAPGKRDDVRVRVRWLDGGEATLLFRECHALKAAMNFGVIAEERILSASMMDDDTGLHSIRKRWNSLGVALDRLRCYRIETSSTASVLRIYAQQFDIE